MKENPLRDKAYVFALKIITIYKALQKESHENVLSRQLLRAGTSIGANTEEAIGAQSMRDFLSKVSIAYKEARETHYWLRLLRDSMLLEANSANLYLGDMEKLIKLMGGIISTTKKRLSNWQDKMSHCMFLLLYPYPPRLSSKVCISKVYCFCIIYYRNITDRLQQPYTNTGPGSRQVAGRYKENRSEIKNPGILQQLNDRFCNRICDIYLFQLLK